MMGSVTAAAYLLMLVGCTSVVGARLARFAGAASALDAWIVALLGASSVFALELILLGLVHLFVAPAVAGLAVVTALVAWRWLPARTPWPSVGRLGRLDRAVLAVGLVFGGLGLAFSLSGVTAEYDSRHYHLLYAATWLNDGDIVHIPPSQPGDLTAAQPADSELMAAALMMATHSDPLGGAINLPFFVLAVLATAAITRSLGGRPAFGALAGLAMVAAPVVTRTQLAAVTNDPFVYAGIASAVAIALRCGRDARFVDGLLIGCGLGLAAGSKLAAIPAVLAVSVVCAGMVRRRRAAVGAVAAASALSAVWYVRDAVVFRNPLFPLRVTYHGTTLLPGLGDPPPGSGQLPSFLLVALRDPLDLLPLWIFTMLWLYGAVFLLLPAAFLRGRQEWSTARRWTLGAAGLLFLAYAVTPYTGGGEPPTGLGLGPTVRFAFPSLLLLVAVAAASRLEPLVLGVSITGLAFDLQQLLSGFDARPDLRVDGFLAVRVLAIASIAGLTLVLWQRRRRLAWAAGGAVALAGCAALLPSLRTEPDHFDPALVARAGHSPGIALINVLDTRALMGESLSNPLLPLGSGQPGELDGPRTAADLDGLLRTLHPSLVAVGDFPDWYPPPSGWHIPPDWRPVGTSSFETTVYAPP
jgi:hypothetical protein